MQRATSSKVNWSSSPFPTLPCTQNKFWGKAPAFWHTVPNWGRQPCAGNVLSPNKISARANWGNARGVRGCQKSIRRTWWILWLSWGQYSSQFSKHPELLLQARNPNCAALLDVRSTEGFRSSHCGVQVVVWPALKSFGLQWFWWLAHTSVHFCSLLVVSRWMVYYKW